MLSIELVYLLGAVVVGALYLSAQSLFLRKQMGIIDANGPRDNDPVPDKMSARGERALRNFYETFPLFVALIVVIELSGTQDSLTAWGCYLYVWGRVAFLPLVLFGLAPWRSLAWMVSAVGLMLLFAGAIG